MIMSHITAIATHNDITIAIKQINLEIVFLLFYYTKEPEDMRIPLHIKMVSKSQ